MRRLLAWVAAIALAVASPAEAQITLRGTGSVTTGGGGAYTGPGDILTYSAWYGLRAYSSATRGTATINLCNVADVACADVASDATTGAIPNAPVIGGVTCGTSVGVNLCTIKIWYDQTGNGHTQTQTTIGSRMTFTPSCSGLGASLSCGTNNGSDWYNPTGTFTSAQPISVVWAGSRTGNFTTQGNVLEISGGGIQVGYNTSANTLIGYFGTVVSATATDSAWHVIQMLGNSASGKITVDNSTTSSLFLGTNSASSSSIYLMGGNTSRFPTMNFVEGGMLSGDYSTSTSTTCGNSNTYWGTSLSC